MVEFKTIEAKEVKFGKNDTNFIEISRREIYTPFGKKEFIAISRGVYLADNSKRYRGSITLPDDKSKRDEIADLIKSF